jgi:hypothetical protein
MMQKHVPPRLWDFGLDWICEVSNVTVNSSRYSNGRTPLEIITGITPDITEYLDFGFYDWVLFRNNAGLGTSELGRWLGVSHRVGQLMSYWILPKSGIPVSCTTVQRLTRLEQATREWGERMEAFDRGLVGKLSASPNSELFIPQTNDVPTLEVAGNEDSAFVAEFGRVIDDPDLLHVDDLQRGDAYDPYVNMEVALPFG